MAPPYRPRPLRKDHVTPFFKASKTLVLSDSARPSTLAPNIRSLAWSPTGSMLAASTSVHVRVWNPDRPDVKASAEMKDGPKGGAHVNAVEKVAFSPRLDAVLASTGLDGMVKVWDVRMPGGAAVVAGGGGGGGGGSGGAAAAAASSSTGAAGGAGPTIGAKGAVIPKAGEHKMGDQTLFLTWHPNGTEILAGRKDDMVQAIDLRRADVVMDASSSSSGPAKKYDLTATERLPAGNKGLLNTMSFSNSGHELFVTTSEGPVKIYDYPSMRPVHTLSAHTSSTYAVQHSPAGNYVAVGASDSMITLWDTTSWLCAQVLTEHTAAVRDVSFSFDGAYLVAGSGGDGPRDGEKGLMVWHVDTGELVHTVDTLNAPTWVAWHPFRYAVAYAGDPGGVKVVGSLSGL